MKHSTAFLSIMVMLSLAFSIAAFAIVAQNNNLFAPPISINSPSASPTTTWTTPPSTNPPITKTPTIPPTPTPPNSIFKVNYTITSQQEINENTSRATLTTTAVYHNGSQITVNYSDFYLQLSVGRWVQNLDFGTTAPLNGGSFTLGPQHPTETFQLMFEFPTRYSNGMDMMFTCIGLRYSGPASARFWGYPDYPS